jgi:hypothetical protein
MSRAPKGDLGTMPGITKEAAVAAVPFRQAPPAAPTPKAPVAPTAGKSLTVKLSGDLYEALRAYCYETGRATGTRVTHQDVMVEALQGFLAAKG